MAVVYQKKHVHISHASTHSFSTVASSGWMVNILLIQTASLVNVQLKKGPRATMGENSFIFSAGQSGTLLVISEDSAFSYLYCSICLMCMVILVHLQMILRTILVYSCYLCNLANSLASFITSVNVAEACLSHQSGHWKMYNESTPDTFVSVTEITTENLY